MSKKNPARFVRRFVDLAQRFLGLVVLVLEIVRRILDLLR
jgi:hypothetical protein